MVHGAASREPRAALAEAERGAPRAHVHVAARARGGGGAGQGLYGSFGGLASNLESYIFGVKMAGGGWQVAAFPPTATGTVEVEVEVKLRGKAAYVPK
eukprot:scaffold61322_cov19-Tisochrysis_lutea.AAC.1